MLCSKALESRTQRYWLWLSFVQPQCQPISPFSHSPLPFHLHSLDSSHHGRHVHHRRAASRLPRRASPPIAKLPPIHPALYITGTCKLKTADSLATHSSPWPLSAPCSAALHSPWAGRRKRKSKGHRSMLRARTRRNSYSRWILACADRGWVGRQRKELLMSL